MTKYADNVLGGHTVCLVSNVSKYLADNGEPQHAWLELLQQVHNALCTHDVREKEKKKKRKEKKEKEKERKNERMRTRDRKKEIEKMGIEKERQQAKDEQNNTGNKKDRRESRTHSNTSWLLAQTFIKHREHKAVVEHVLWREGVQALNHAQCALVRLLRLLELEEHAVKGLKLLEEIVLRPCTRGEGEDERGAGARRGLRNEGERCTPSSLSMRMY